MKKWIWGLGATGVILLISAFLLGRFVFPSGAPEYLPKPEVAEGQRGELGIDKNVNEATIDKYLGRPDAVYIDLRMLQDPVNYEAIGGDADLSGFVRGFEVVPLPYIVNVTGLPEEVGETYTGTTLFTFDGEKYIPNFEESMDILETLFPKDKILFLMCGGGGYAGMMKKMLVALGWDETKIYVVGGYWFYEGENRVEVKRTRPDGTVVYDFYKVPYHEIDFSQLTKVEAGELISISVASFEKMSAERRSFLVLIDQAGCRTADELKGYLRNFLESKGWFGYRMMFSEVKETTLSEYIKYYPSVVVIKNGEVFAYLKADAEEDADKYNNYEIFQDWIEPLF